MLRLFVTYRGKLISLAILLTLIPSIIVGGFMYIDRINAENENVKEKIVTVSSMGATNIGSQYSGWIETVKSLSNNHLLVSESKNLLSNADTTEEFKSSKSRLEKQFEVLLQTYDWIQEIAISDPDTGEVKMVVGTDFFKVSLKSEGHFKQAVNEEMGLTDIYPSEVSILDEEGRYKTGVPTMLISAQMSSEGLKGGILTARINVFKLKSEVQHLLARYYSSEIYLVNKEGFLLSKPKSYDQARDLGLFQVRPELELKITDPETKDLSHIILRAQNKILWGKNTYYTPDGQVTIWDISGYNNYRGVEVIGAITQVPNTDWYFISEVYKAESNKELDNLRNFLIAFFIIFLGISVIIGVFFANKLSIPIKKLTAVIEDVSMGRLDVEIDPELKESGDEIGHLAQAFDRTIVSLKLAMKSTESEITKRIKLKEAVEKQEKEAVLK